MKQNTFLEDPNRKKRNTSGFNLCSIMLTSWSFLDNTITTNTTYQLYICTIIIKLVMIFTDRAYCTSDKPCRNDALCEDVEDGYVCHCRDGFTGRNCSGKYTSLSYRQTGRQTDRVCVFVWVYVSEESRPAESQRIEIYKGDRLLHWWLSVHRNWTMCTIDLSVPTK